jgi:hypothetical protein
MGQQHFVAVGGTGQHVALALVDLAVLCEGFLPFEPTRLWLFDADVGGTSDAPSAWDLASRQVGFLRRGDRSSDAVWRDPIKAQYRPYDERLTATRFGDALPADARDLLFSPDQAAVSFRNGFYGQPAVGAAMFSTLLHNRKDLEFFELLAAPKEEDSRVVVAGSAVGGTGSGCLPFLVERLGNPASNGRYDMSGRLAALLFLPWFKLQGGDGKGEQRNSEMIARTASGLLYYQERLAKVSATVLLGHPEIASLRWARPWHGDSRQPRHDDLSIPFYGAAVAARLLAGEASKPGLYALARPASGPLLDGAARVSRQSDPRRVTLASLLKANKEFVHRAGWVCRYLERAAEGFPAALSDRLMIRALPATRSEWIAPIRAWINAKADAARRLDASLRAMADASGGPASGEIRERPLEGGIPAVASWFGAHQPESAEALCQALAEEIRLQGAAVGTASIERLLPARRADSQVEAAPKAAPVGELEELDSGEAGALILPDRVSPKAVPSVWAREQTLQWVFARRLPVGSSLDQLLQRREVATGDVDALIQQWLCILVGAAGGKVRVEGDVDVVARDGQVPLFEASDSGAAHGRPAANKLLWRDDTADVTVGYTNPDVLLVPAPLDTRTWERLFASIPRRTEVATAVWEWARLLGRVGRASKAELPGWLSFLVGAAPERAGAGIRTFGLHPGGIETSWGPTRLRSIPLPDAPGRADESWFRLFESFELNRVAQAQMTDQDARVINDVLGHVESFTYFKDDGTSERRRALWLDGDHSGARTVAAVLNERFYVSEVEGSVWDLQGEGPGAAGPVEVLTDARIELPEIGWMEVEDKRYPDLPIRHNYVDLVDLSKVERASARSGQKSVSYRIAVHGRTRPLEVAPVLQDKLKIKAGCLLWPNFAAPGWRQRYALVAAREPYQCRIFSSEGPGARITGMKSLHVSTDGVPEGFELPGQAWMPRLITFARQTGVHHGIYLLDTKAVEPKGRESWGVDFGTHASVVAVAQPGVGIQGATILEPLGRYDATEVVHHPVAITLERLQWFPTWNGRGPRSDEQPRLLPTRIVFRNPKRRSDDLLAEDGAFGRAWMIDHGGKLDGRSELAIESDLKWGKDNSKRRSAYLLHLLEQAAAWRASIQDAKDGRVARLPTFVRLVFTLPLSMRNDLERYRTDVHGVVEKLKRRTGIQFEFGFEWESTAASVPRRARRDDKVFAALDLGGGSLDVWGAFRPPGAAVGMDDGWKNRADSFVVGGSALLEALGRRAGEGHDLDEKMRSSSPNDPFHGELHGIPTFQDTVSVFFEVVTEACARWLACLVLEARAAGLPAKQLEVAILGRGWYLGDGSWSSSGRALRQLSERVRKLGVEVELQEYREVPTEIREKKSYLAKAAAAQLDTGARLTANDDIGGYVGMDLLTAKDVLIPWSTPLPVLGIDPDSQLFLPESAGKENTPALPTKLGRRLAASNGQLKQKLNHSIPNAGLRSQGMNQLELSPFVSSIDAVISAWRRNAEEAP